MKFPHIPIGTRFEYEGKVYVKTGPVTAASEQGGQRMMPRHAVVGLFDAVPAPASPRAGRMLAENTVLAAFDAFYVSCTDLVEAAARDELAAARARFLAALD